MAREFDLLGDPIPDGRGKPGRTGHIATAENVNKVRDLLVSGLTKKDIAQELGVSVPNLNKHYFTNGKDSLRLVRHKALAEARAKNFLQLQKAAGAGNVSAIKAVGNRLDRMVLELMDKDVTHPASRKGELSRPMGKKENDVSAAQQAEAELEAIYGSGRPN